MKHPERGVVTSDTQRQTCILIAKHLNKAVYPFYQKMSFQLCDYKAAQQRLLSLAIASLLRTGHKLDFTLRCIGLTDSWRCIG